jgi:HEAT repeat protein
MTGGIGMKEIVKKLNDTAAAERWKSVLELEKFGKPAVEYLSMALKDKDKWVRYVAADALGNIGDAGCIDCLVESMQDPDQDVRFATAGALGRIGGAKAIAALNTACSTDNCFVRIAAEDALQSCQIKK